MILFMIFNATDFRGILDPNPGVTLLSDLNFIKTGSGNLVLKIHKEARGSVSKIERYKTEL